MSDHPFIAMHLVTVPGRIVTKRGRKPTASTAFFLLLLFTTVVYARPQDIFPVVTVLHLPLVFGICAAVAYVLALLSGDTRLYLPRELQIVLLLTAWYLVGIPFAEWKTGSLLLFTQTWLKTLFAFFLLVQTLSTIRRIRLLIWAIILSECAVALLTLLGRQHAIWHAGRLFGFNQGFLGWNFFGIAAAMTIPYIGVLCLSTRSFWRTTLLGAAFGSLVSMLILTASRSGVLTVIPSIVLTSILILRHTGRGRNILAVLSLIVIIAAAQAPTILWTRLSTLTGSSGVDSDQTVSSANASTEQRTVLLQRSIQYTLNHPFLGLGLGNFATTSGAEFGAAGWYRTHNTFTELSSEAGLPALMLFIWLLIVVLRKMNGVSKRLHTDPSRTQLCLMARATTISVVSFALGGLFANLSYDYYLFYSVALAVAVQQVAAKTAESGCGFTRYSRGVCREVNRLACQD